jgi:hypothetical protein
MFAASGQRDPASRWRALAIARFEIVHFLGYGLREIDVENLRQEREADHDVRQFADEGLGAVAAALSQNRVRRVGFQQGRLTAARIDPTRRVRKEGTPRRPGGKCAELHLMHLA